MKKIITLFFCSIMMYSQLQSIEKPYMNDALVKIETEIAEAKGLDKTALCYENLDKWFKLLAKMEIPAEKKREILTNNHQKILNLSDQYLSFIDHLYNEDHKTISVQYNGTVAEAFQNLDSERFSQEKESFQEYGIFKSFTLKAETLEQVKIKTCYNFIVSTQGEVVLGDLQEYDELMMGDKKILLAPNHALLAEGKPVMVAGEITLIGDHDFKLWMVGMTSGHYHPAASSKKYIIEKLIEMGIPEEQIIVFGFQIHKLPWKLLEKKQSWFSSLFNN